SFFGCGSVVVNKRYDNHKEHIYRYCVRRLEDLQTKIIPFFEKNNLRTAKHNDFIFWKDIIIMMARKEHTDMNGLTKIAKLIEQMNRRKPSQFLESSETKRQVRICG
ncbi:MAG: LAGLIDADG family homing endonuclease, partial [Candidatus Yonathbacteria bacterium]|nr:LAGLIDADG family homing endonuclease [Candidatus Yonathbacteria bacterium]